KIEPPVFCHPGEHVVEERDAGLCQNLPGPVRVERECDCCLLCLPCKRNVPHRDSSSASERLIFPLYSAEPSTAPYAPASRSAATSARAETPPATITGTWTREISSRTGSMATPCCSPSTSTLV